MPRPEHASVGGLDWLPPVLFILLHNPLNSDSTGYGSQIILRVSRILAAALPVERRAPMRQVRGSGRRLCRAVLTTNLFVYSSTLLPRFSSSFYP